MGIRRERILKRLRERWDDARRVIDMASLIGLEHGVTVYFGPSRLDYRPDLVRSAIKMAEVVERVVNGNNS